MVRCVTGTVALLLAFLVVGHGRCLLGDDRVSADDKHGKYSPPYKVLNKTDDVEIRMYENATWAVAFGRSRWSTDFAAVQAGIGLAKYFKGGNTQHKVIGKTVPIVGTVLRPHPPPHKNGSHPKPPPPKNGSHPKPPPHHRPPGPPAVAIAGFIPNTFKGEAPKPDNRHVKILHTNETKIYSHRFGGWAISWVVRKEIGHLASALKDQGICPLKGKFFVATYDGPWKIQGRRNEIWWAKKPKHGNHSESSMDAEYLRTAGLEALDVELLFPEDFEVDVPAEPSVNPTKVFIEEGSGAGAWKIQDGSDAESFSVSPKKIEGQDAKVVSGAEVTEVTEVT